MGPLGTVLAVACESVKVKSFKILPNFSLWGE